MGFFTGGLSDLYHLTDGAYAHASIRMASLHAFSSRNLLITSSSPLVSSL